MEKYSITLPVKSDAVNFVLGVLLKGQGKVRVSSLRLLVDGKPISKAPWPDIPFYKDHSFDTGSGIEIKSLTKIQIANLVTLGKVWGFLKYYHPVVTSGGRQWDYDLLRIIPSILQADSRDEAHKILVNWIDSLGTVEPCDTCAKIKSKGIQLLPPVDWITNKKRLGKKLSNHLQWIYENRRTGNQFYVSVSKAKNPTLKHERAYQDVKFPDSGFQLLALYRFWNIIKYWYPYRYTIDENWGTVLKSFVPRLALATNRKNYELQLMALIAKIHDTHADLWSSLEVRPPSGPCHLPVRIRYVQDSPVVTGYIENHNVGDSPFELGDVIVKLGDNFIDQLFQKWAPYYGASNKAALERKIATYMTRGACEKISVTVRRKHHIQRLEAHRVPISKGYLYAGTRDLPGPTFQLLSPKVAYLKLSSIQSGKLISYLKRAL